MSSGQSSLQVSAPTDFHVHLRQDAMSSLIVPHVRQGGVTTAYVMPNTIPPITTVDQCIAYLDELESHDEQLHLIGTLYLHPSLSREEIKKAAATRSKRTGLQRVMGVKSYPRGVTTNSEGGIESYEAYYEVFDEMEKQGMVLNLHGEVPSNEEQVSMVQEQAAGSDGKFAEYYRYDGGSSLSFPSAKDSQEVSKASDRSRTCYYKGSGRCCQSLRRHGRLYNYPAPLGPGCRRLGGKASPLLQTGCENIPRPQCASGRYQRRCVHITDEERTCTLTPVIGHPRFFLGSDSAPHPVSSKLPSAATHGSAYNALNCGCAAGIYTSSILLPLCATLLDSFGALDSLQKYVSDHGRRFYGLPSHTPTTTVTLRKSVSAIPESYTHPMHADEEDGTKGKIQVVPFWAGKELPWTIE